MVCALASVIQFGTVSGLLYVLVSGSEYVLAFVIRSETESDL